MKPITQGKTRWGLSRFERIMSLLTLLGLIVAILTGFIFWEQLDQMRTDERPFVSMLPNPVQFPKDAQAAKDFQVIATVTLKNIGKTAARKVHTELVMDYVVNGQSPDFVYDGRAKSTNTAGVIFPDNPMAVIAGFAQLLPAGGLEPRFLSPYEFNSLSDARGYMVLYGRTTYEDIFGTEHWTKYCVFFVPPATQGNVSAKACSEYNDTDHDETGLFRWLWKKI